MNVLIITALYPPAAGGASVYFSDVVPHLSHLDRIEKLTVLTERMHDQPRESDEGKLRLLRYLPNRVSGTRRSWLGHATSYLFTQLWFAARLPGLVRSHKGDLIHFHTRYRGKLFYSALRRSGVPVVADLRDKMSDPGRLANVAARLLCCGEGVRRYALDGGFPAERTRLIPIPFTLPDIPSLERVSQVRHHYGLGDERYVLFVGDITHNKGVFDLLDAFRRWQRQHPEVRLVLAGPNREGQRFLRELHRTPGTVYLGRTPHGDALALMRGAEIVALPSRSEGLPRVILEAVALGTKVMCPPDIPEFDRHMPDFVLPEVTVDAIADMLELVWLAHEIPSYPFARHSVVRVSSQILDAYRDVMSRG